MRADPPLTRSGKPREALQPRPRGTNDDLCACTGLSPAGCPNVECQPDTHEVKEDG